MTKSQFGVGGTQDWTILIIRKQGTIAYRYSGITKNEMFSRKWEWSIKMFVKHGHFFPGNRE
jgi:hypothetical protein